MISEYKIAKDSVKVVTEDGIFSELSHKDPEIFFIVSGNVMNLYSEKFKNIDPSNIFAVEDGEASKSLHFYEKLIGQLASKNFERNNTIAYVGGGTIGDLAGFVSSTYKRGVNLIAVPTTILSMVDSSLGGKNGLNFNGIKNLLGTFKNPSEVIIDTSFISGNKKMLREALGEIVKHGLMLDNSINELLLSNDATSIWNDNQIEKLIMLNVDAKMSVCEKDPFETLGIRNVLNFGHTVGHAIEAVSLNRISHGYAVMLGMRIESEIARNLGYTEYNPLEIIDNITGKYEINMPKIDSKMLEESEKYIMNDKKISSGILRIPVPVEPGKHRIIDIKADEFIREMKKAGEKLCS
ncbi:3-dehydroquinate synthase [Cuniculiplasma sp. SKW3]|uniref:3-dehydroquinate synthase n=1 Tax=unclassified Cuniculiplasma TaxID=2619706 RepID=UPI003FD42F7D